MSGKKRFNSISSALKSLDFPVPSKKALLKLNVVIGFTLNTLVFYPGFMSPDSLNQFQQASANSYSDWHPPIMAWVWRQLNFVFVPPTGLLFLQMLLLWGSVYLLALEYVDSRFKPWVMILLPFFPGILSISGVIWKDVQMAFSLLAVLALNYVRRQRIIFVVSLFLVIYAVALRANAIFALPPLAILGAFLVFKNITKLKVFSLSIVATIAIFTGSSFLVQVLTHPVKANLASVALQDDLAYFSLIKGYSLIPSVPLDHIKECATATPGGSPMYVVDVCLATLGNREANSPEIYTEELREVWLQNIKEDPIQYLRFRLYGFNVQLRAPGVPPRYIWNDGIVENEFGFKALNGGFTSATKRSVDYIENNFDFFFKPFFWAWLNIVIGILLFGMQASRRRNLLLSFNFSGLTYLFSYFFVNASDYRYSYWMTVITIFVSVLAYFEYGSKFLSIAPRHRKIKLIMIALLTILLFNWTSIFDINLIELSK